MLLKPSSNYYYIDMQKNYYILYVAKGAIVDFQTDFTTSVQVKDGDEIAQEWMAINKIIILWSLGQSGGGR